MERKKGLHRESEYIREVGVIGAMKRRFEDT